MPDSKWRTIHDEKASWRDKLLGELSESFVTPRYVEIFKHYFQNSKPSTFLELGSGTGDVAQKIVQNHFDFITSYTVSENFSEGVEWLRKKGLTARLLDAEHVSVLDESFDVVMCFDVLHHVDHPRQMAYEMLRAGRGRLFLTESNGLSLGRKIMELTPGHRRAGEKSYTPRKYLSFFNHPEFEVTKFEIHPFIFPIRVSGPAVEWVTRFNRWIETIPFLKWQCSNVYIYVEYRRRQRAKSDSTCSRVETEHWQELYRSGALVKHRKSSHFRKLKRIDVLKSNKDIQFLDIACGEGEMLDLLDREGFSHLYGSDIVFDEAVIQRQKQKKWKYLASSAMKLPFKNESFDWILCAHSLHHLGPNKNIENLIAESYRCLKPGGYLGLIDHFDSFQLRLFVNILMSPLALLTPWTREFRKQQLEEKEYFFDFLNRWSQTEKLLLKIPFAKINLKKKVFFFYLVAQK